jgi:hypothetical protein
MSLLLMTLGYQGSEFVSHSLRVFGCEDQETVLPKFWDG